MTQEAMAAAPASPPARGGATGSPVEVVHLLLEGDLDGIGLHVLELAAAQLASGTVAPHVVTGPSPAYARRLEAAGIPHTFLAHAGFRNAIRRAVAADLVPSCHVLHLHGRRAAQLLLIAGSLRRTRAARHILGGHTVVATCHGWLSDTLRRRMRRYTELRSYALLDLLVTSSAEQADVVSARRARPPRIAFVPNGVALDPRPDGAGARGREMLTGLGVPGDVELVGNVGRLAPEKRQDVFLEACVLIARTYPDVHFVVLGEGRERRTLERRAEQVGIADRVHLVGFVDDVAAACANFSLLMHTSDTEGTPRAVVEAMATGVPVVATAVGGVPALVEDGVTGLLVPRGDSQALAQAALHLLEHPLRAAVLGERGRRRAEVFFSAQAMAQRVEELYRSCLPDRVGSAP